MKKLLLFTLFCAVSGLLFAPADKSLPVLYSDAINPYSGLMSAILQVESAGDTLAYNPIEQAYGPFQIRPIRLTDYNQRTGKSYKMTDCFKMSVSREVFTYYAAQIGPYDFERIAKNWNGSGEMTEDYWKRVKAELNGERN